MTNLSLKRTNDGSYTIFNDALKETYHSIHGARQEALHVFIENGLFKMPISPVRILEIGLGTGLNALLTCRNKRERLIDYVGLEPFPLSKELLKDFIEKNAEGQEEKDLWTQLMESDDVIQLENFSLTKVTLGIQDFTSIEPFDLIYFDAFAPSKQEEMWQESVFQHIAALSRKCTQVVTYCAQGQFKRNLKMAGFEVKSLPGPPGKREMTVGIKE